MLYSLKTINKIKKRVVSGGGLAPTRSYSDRWQVARIGLCGLGA